MSKPISKRTAKTPVASGAKAKSNGSAKIASRKIEQAAIPIDWRSETLAEVRRLILSADPAVVEERKWIKPSNPQGVPTWSHAGIICTGETYKNWVKLTFARGAALADPHGLFNSSLEGHTRRAIDLHEGEHLDAAAFQALIQAAVALNLQVSTARTKPARKPAMCETGSVKLLSGGNPQIAKADGDAPVQTFIAAMPGWKHAVGRQLDALIVRAVPNVIKAVKWNTPMYGVEGAGWFLGFHCITKYVKVAFFRGTALYPLPPVASRQKEVRYLHIHEGDSIDEQQVMEWVKQAAALPGANL